jgi:transcriptional regulator with XRE-family HTH domain
MMMERASSAINARIAARVRDLRAARELTLDALAERSGVSRAMISRVERGESSPTAVVLDKIATGLGVVLAALFDVPPPEPAPVARRAEQPVWRDPASGYVRRNLSPPGASSPIQMVEVTFPPGARVSYESGPRRRRMDQQIWILDGTIEVTVDQARHRLERGDCLAMELSGPTSFHNPTRKTARYVVVVATEPDARSRS